MNARRTAARRPSWRPGPVRGRVGEQVAQGRKAHATLAGAHRRDSVERRWKRGRNERDGELCADRDRSHSQGALLYGLTTSGVVYEYNFSREVWIPLPMRALSEGSPGDINVVGLRGPGGTVESEPGSVRKRD